MYSTTMSETNKDTLGRKKVKKKMSKAQIQLAIIKKKQCDAKALVIVEQLLEPGVESNWLVDNLRYVNKSHMEDVIEERALGKLCGYVLCNNPLTKVINQQYYISTRRNKVYDVSRRKHFCSSLCYGAANYLLEQMLTSPLWLREKEDIPIFHFLPLNRVSERSVPGEEVNMGNINTKLHTDDEKEKAQSSLMKEKIKNLSSDDLFDAYINEESNLERAMLDGKNIEVNQADVEGDSIDDQASNNGGITESTCTSAQSKQKLLDQEGNIDDIEMKYSEIQKIKLDESLHDKKEIVQKENLEVDTADSKKLSQIIDTTWDETADITQISDSVMEIAIDNKSKIRKCQAKESKKSKRAKNDDGVQQPDQFYTLAMRVEKSVKEWMTDDTHCLLSGEANRKNQIIESVTQREKYVQLCKKLNKVQLVDEREDREELSKNALKPLPHFDALQEEGKKMELKVHAFYKGDMIIRERENVEMETGKEDEAVSVLPLTDIHAPKVLRRRIFLDKLNRMLPDLLRTLAGTKQSYLISQYTYSSERCALIKALVTTFSLSATNIVFKTAEWTLVGLIIIKMLSVIDIQLRGLLRTKQASMYTSMILMSYKLDSNYLDRLIIEITNNPKIFEMV
ncbi:hypothetical protein KM043_017284 [Ampulex compressa]|nr:hypothetical protein KM043_017284 [Ampulex compressa]